MNYSYFVNNLITTSILGLIIGIWIGFLIFLSIESERLPESHGVTPEVDWQVVKPVPTPGDGFDSHPADNSSSLRRSFVGKASYYTFDGCLGCNSERITTSGDVLDDSKLTLAIPAQWRDVIPMGTMVRITNLDNNKSVIAKVNDTGGFYKYDRIADVSLAVRNSIDLKTDESTIVITLVD